jgi:hypothetical protein
VSHSIAFDRWSRRAAACLLAAVVACGRGRDSGDANRSGEDAPDTVASADGGATEQPAPPASAEAASAPLTTADIDRWERGLAGELEAVRAAAARLKTATSGEDTLSAMMGVQEASTIPAGAKAAGVDLERYKVIRSNLSAAASYLAPQLGGVDTTMLSPEQRAEMKRMNETQLKQLEDAVPAGVVEALRPRAAELRKKDLELVGERLKGVGA